MRVKENLRFNYLATVLFIVVGSVSTIECEAKKLHEMIEWEDINVEVSVDIVAFNYTDRIIDSFSVNGQGGGNIFLSTQTSGGGKSACCVTLPAVHKGVSKMRVRWQVDGCIYITKSKISGEIFKNIYPYYRQADIEVIHPKKFKPQHLEIHFYPDGAVRAELTAELSLPRMLLDGKRTDKSNFPRCRDGKKPE